jgi:hypothetical protein
VYALALAGECDAASRLAHVVDRRDADEWYFWKWLTSTFGVVPADDKQE